MLLITHDLGVVADMTQRTAVMYAGFIVETATTAELFAAPRHPYTVGLLHSVARIDVEDQGTVRAIEGQPPDGTRPPTGCPFAPRCAWRLPICWADNPPLVAADGRADGRHHRGRRLAPLRLPSPADTRGGARGSPTGPDIPAGAPSDADHGRGLGGGRMTTAVPPEAAAAPSDTTPPDPSRPLVDVRDLHVHFPIGGLSFRRERGVIRAVDGVDLAIPRGTTLGLVGESGSGKTTTGRAIVRLLDPTSGSIRFDGQEIATLRGEPLRRLRKRFQMIFQDPYSSLNPRMTIAGIVGEALDIHGIGTRKERAERVAELLQLVGLPARVADRYPHQFSGGQRQRVGVARALAVDPDLIVADEPVSALDVSIRAQILNLLVRLQDRLDLTYIVVSHDLAAVRRISDTVAVMYLGRIVELAPTAQLFGGALHPYTIALISAVPIPDPALQVGRRRIILTGEIPSPASPPPGCHFHTRCWLYRRLGEPERCRAERPPLVDLRAGHAAACHFSAEVEGTPEQRQAMGRGVPSAVGQATETIADPPAAAGDDPTLFTSDDEMEVGGNG